MCRLRRLFAALAALIVLVAGMVSPLQASPDSFPCYDCMNANVAFWVDIYGRYPASKGVLHDKRNLAIIYEALDVEGTWENGARERDREKVEKAREKYRTILERLAAGDTSGPEGKRVAALFGEKATSEEYLAARENIRFQSGQKDNFRAGLIRSGSYLAEMKKIMAGHGLPEDLAYLPHVESSFNYKAYSKFGAAGVWQFTESTGKRYLTIDYALDERRDPLKATHAAARLLKLNYEKLGTWPLAITAYNHGLNGMLRAKAAKGDYERIFLEHESELFKFASRNFYSEFIAARQVAKNYTEYFGPLKIDSPVQSKLVSLPEYAALADLLKHLKVDLETFKALNPALREPVYLGQKLIPKDYEVRVPSQEKTLRLAEAIPAEIFKSEQPLPHIYQVKEEDSAASIAGRFGLSVGELLKYNGLDDQAAICLGQNLRIPGPEERKIAVAATGPQKKPESGKAAESASTPPTDKPQIKPEAVSSAVAAKSGERPVIEPQARKIPAGKVQETAESGKGKKAEAAPEKGAMCPPLHPAKVLGNLSIEVVKGKGQAYGLIRVEPEENLTHYARWLDIRAWDIRKLNGFSYEQPLAVGRQVKIPLSKGSKEKFDARRYEFHKELVEDFFAAYRLKEKTRTYRVKQGDTVWSLCQNEFELPLWLLKKYNPGVDFSQLKHGVQLVVPLVEPIR